MRRLFLAALAVAAVAGCAQHGGHAPTVQVDAQAVLQQADRAMGGEGLTSLRFDAQGTGGVFGQAYRPGEAWPRINYPQFSRVYDYAAGGIRENWVRNRAEPNGGGAIPLMGQGNATVSAFAQGDWAWNMMGPAPVPAPVARLERLHDLWTSPHGAIKAAMRYNPRAERHGQHHMVSFAVPGVVRAKVHLGADGLVHKVESVYSHHVMGDTQVVLEYSNYRDHQGTRFPGRIRQTQGGHPVLDLQVTEVQRNAPTAFTVPALVSAFTERVASEEVSKGVWFLAGGSHNSVLIEMADHAILVEAPLYDGRTQAVLAEAKRLLPSKPIRRVVNSHHHFDHSGGLRTAAADGATLVTSALAKPWFERVMAQANTVTPDALARSGRRVNVEGVSGQLNLSDRSRQVMVHTIEGTVHAQGFMMVWLPESRLLIEADAYTPLAPNAPPPNPLNDNHVKLVQNIEALRLNVDRILPLHGRVVPMAELRRTAGMQR
jgi:glyoxylase-like metal-dependent hydrolase (beta-lactamase superfamily II)